jgi:hypothetical protein
MNPYSNLIEALEGLICQGYDRNFILKKDYLKVRNSHYKINYNEFEVQQIYYFEDPDPKSEAIIYGISSEKHHIKGLIISNEMVFSKNGFKAIKNKLQH